MTEADENNIEMNNLIKDKDQGPEEEVDSSKSNYRRLSLRKSYSKPFKSTHTIVNTPFKSPVISLPYSFQQDAPEPIDDTLDGKEADPEAKLTVPSSIPRKRISSFKSPILSNVAKSTKKSLISPKLALVQAQADLRTIKLVLKNCEEEPLLENLIIKWQKVSRDALEHLRDQIGEGQIGRRMRLDELCSNLKIDITLLGKYYNPDMDSFEDSPLLETKSNEC